MNVLLIVIFGVAIGLTLMSGWMYSTYLYYAIVGLFAAGFVVDVVGDFVRHGVWDWKAIVVDLWIFGLIFYFIAVQKLTSRRLSSAVSGGAFKAYLVENNAYSGFPKFVHLLPRALIVVGIAAAAYWKFVAAG